MPRVISGSGVSAGNVLVVDADGNGDYTTIQAAINAAYAQGPTLVDQWLVLVGPGQYQESLTLYDYVNISSFSPDKAAYLNGTGASAIQTAATCTVSNLRVRTASPPAIKTGSFAAGKFLNLRNIIIDEETPDIDAVQVTTGWVNIYFCYLKAGGIIAYVGASGTLKVFDSKLIRYYTGSGSSNPVVQNAGGVMEIVRTNVENRVAAGEAITFSAAPSTQARILHSIIKASAAATYSIGATVAVNCLVSGCLLNKDLQTANISDAVDYMITDDL